MARVLGLCNLHNAPKLGCLNNTRSIASTSFLGRYAFIDFTLSNFANSNINQMGILVEKHLRSLVKHVGSGRMYNSNTKTGSCSIMYNERSENTAYNTDLNNLRENHWVLDRSNADYIVIAPAHFLDRIDFKEVLKYHIENKASVTMVYYKTKSRFNAIDIDELKIDDNGRVTEISPYKGASKSFNLSLETYVISRNKLEDFLNFGQMTSKFFSLRDVLSYLASQLYIHSYEYKGFVRSIDSLESYYNVSLELLNQDKLYELFDPSWPIITRTYDTPPAKYGDNADVSNCFICNGSIIDGKVENSIVARDVKIGKGSKIKNSIILTGAKIGENIKIENCIIDKKSIVSLKKELIGEKDKPLIVKEGDRV